MQSLTKHRGERNGLTSNFSPRFPFWAWRTLVGYEAIHMIRKAKRVKVRRVEWAFCCPASYLVWRPR